MLDEDVLPLPAGRVAVGVSDLDVDHGDVDQLVRVEGDVVRPDRQVPRAFDCHVRVEESGILPGHDSPVADDRNVADDGGIGVVAEGSEHVSSRGQVEVYIGVGDQDLGGVCVGHNVASVEEVALV